MNFFSKHKFQIKAIFRYKKSFKTPIKRLSDRRKLNFILFDSLTNLFNTYHTNSLLQALFATEEFRNYVIKEKIEGPLVCEVSKLFNAMALHLLN
jgi:ubiquitin C-terminal hydrolase